MKQVKENAVVANNSHSYSVNTYTVGPNGLEITGAQPINLVRGSKVDGENILSKQDGFLTEQLLWIAQNYLSEVNVGDMKTRETSIAITKIQEALMWINKRHDDRVERKVLNTYNK